MWHLSVNAHNTALFNPQHGRSDLDNPHWSLSLILWVGVKRSSTATEELRKNHTAMQKTDTWVKAWLTFSWLSFCCFPPAKPHRAEGKWRGNSLWITASSWRCPVSRLTLLSCCYPKSLQNQRERIFLPVLLAMKLPWARPYQISALNESAGPQHSCVLRKALSLSGLYQPMPPSLEQSQWVSSTWHQPYERHPWSCHASCSRLIAQYKCGKWPEKCCYWDTWEQEPEKKTHLLTACEMIFTVPTPP